jgi:hypothetical protein
VTGAKPSPPTVPASLIAPALRASRHRHNGQDAAAQDRRQRIDLRDRLGDGLGIGNGVDQGANERVLGAEPRQGGDPQFTQPGHPHARRHLEERMRFLAPARGLPAVAVLRSDAAITAPVVLRAQRRGLPAVARAAIEGGGKAAQWRRAAATKQRSARLDCAFES